VVLPGPMGIPDDGGGCVGAGGWAMAWTLCAIATPPPVAAPPPPSPPADAVVKDIVDDKN
jgi:hypothetical protein